MCSITVRIEISWAKMRNNAAILLVTLCLLSYTLGRRRKPQAGPVTCENANVTQAEEFLQLYNTWAAQEKNALEIAGWTSSALNETVLYGRFRKEMRQIAVHFNLTAMPYDVQRQLVKVMNIGTSALEDEEKLRKLRDIGNRLRDIYENARICEDLLPGFPVCPKLVSAIRPKMDWSRDYDELLKYWVKWRNVISPQMRDLYRQYVELANEAVRILGYNDLGEVWRGYYETPTFESDVRDLFDQIFPLYEQLHAFVRRGLRNFYGKDKFSSTGHIPVHFFDFTWGPVFDLVHPSGKNNRLWMVVWLEMKKQNYTMKKMLTKAEDFFVSLGMEHMYPEFWERSNFECHGCHHMACDFFNGTDFRVKLKPNVWPVNFGTIFYEMGRIQYYMNYKHQPVVYRDGANRGFHAAVGEFMRLSFWSPKHLLKLGLLKELPGDIETNINFLMEMAMSTLDVIPFAYMLDNWRWSVFRGSTSPNSYTRDYWDMRCRYQGISPPVARTENDFDPGVYYHVAAFMPYIRYFLSHILQFQFHKAACKLAGHEGPLHHCDIYNSKEAGAKILEMLRLGSSKPWPEAMKVLTGQEKMDASALLEYFKPLHDYLIQKNAENGEKVGWQAFCPHN